MCNLSTDVYNKGVTEGKMEQARETAYELADMGLSVDKIARAVKFSVADVSRWLDERLVTV